MFATDTTTHFKTHVIDVLEKTQLGYDTRLAYYQAQYPELSHKRLARLICDPIEYYDKNWPHYHERHHQTKTKEQLTVDFFLPLDDGFRSKAQAAIICFDEAGFGTGVNCMRFIHANKPILGFINNPSISLNLDNIYQLQKEYPKLVSVYSNQTEDKITQQIKRWLRQLTEKIKL